MEILEPESLDYTSVFDDIFARYLTRCELVQAKTTNMEVFSSWSIASYSARKAKRKT